jgi:hypothetical protein
MIMAVEEDSEDGGPIWPSSRDATECAVWASSTGELRLARALMTVAVELADREAAQERSRDKTPCTEECPFEAHEHPLPETGRAVYPTSTDLRPLDATAVIPTPGADVTQSLPAWEPTDRCLHCGVKLVHRDGRWLHVTEGAGTTYARCNDQPSSPVATPAK